MEVEIKKLKGQGLRQVRDQVGKYHDAEAGPRHEGHHGLVAGGAAVVPDYGMGTEGLVQPGLTIIGHLARVRAHDGFRRLEKIQVGLADQLLAVKLAMVQLQPQPFGHVQDIGVDAPAGP